MGKFTKEEKYVLIMIVAGAVAGILISVLLSYNQKIETKDIKNERVIVNLNTASVNELTKLPGIGKVYAERIIKYREANKGFKAVDELMKVKGIGEKKLERLKLFVVTDPYPLTPDP